MKGRRTSLKVEGLETRDNPAVTASVVAGDLFITGDAASDSVQLSRLANGAVRIEGLNGTRVNGVTSVDRVFNDDLFVNLGAGNNVLQVLDGNGGVTADDVDIKAGGGADQVSIYRLKVLDDIVVDTNEGDDIVYLNNVTAFNRDNPPNNVGEDGISVYTRGGGDNVIINNSSSPEDVTVGLDTPTSDTAGSADTLYMTNVRAADDFFLYGFGGNDSMYLNTLTAGDVLSVSLGAGDDFLKLTNSQARAKTTLGEAGFDTFQYYNDAYIPGTTTGFESYRNAP
jgi:hypothetical protein